MIRLSREQIEKLTAVLNQRIEHYSVTTYDDGFRSHLGASLIGHECSRYLWYVFRWTFKEQFSGRMRRLFKRGHREEANFIELLRGAGLMVVDHGEDGNQIRIKAVNGHFGGSLDGQVTGITVELNTELGFNLPPMLLEFKTKGTGAGFNNMVKNGVKLENKQHYEQMCMYGKHHNLYYAIYMVVNKNDDSLHLEIVTLDHRVADDALARAEMIINSQQPPRKVSENPAFITCKLCNAKGICHEAHPLVKNCRSCINARPIEDGAWQCSMFGTIPKEYIPAGCDKWIALV